MKIAFVAAAPADPAILALPVGQGPATGARWPGLDGEAAALATVAASAARFEGEAGSTLDLFVPGGGKTRRIVLLGVGSGGDLDWEKAGGALTAKLLMSGASEVTVDLGAAGDAPTAKAAARFAGAAGMRGWRYDLYRTKLSDKQKPTLETITIARAPQGIEDAWRDQDALARGMSLTKRLVTAPPNALYPESFVEWVREEVDGLGLEITVLDEAEMGELGMGALLGVSQGSAKEARLLVLKWNGAGEGDPDLALVGKGVTFDTGGISIKPAAGMEDMKWDMGGAGAVAGAMKAIAGRKAKANVVGVMGLVENMPDGNAIRPGDVLTSMSGQTVEVINTDAEGRLVLCDAITWVQKTHRPKNDRGPRDADGCDDRRAGQ